jgi:hypothetical protein
MMARAKRSRKPAPRKTKIRVLFLETQLPARLVSTSRQQLLFTQEFFKNLPELELVPKQVHSRSDLKKFLDLARRDRSIKTVHLVSHGRYSAKRPVLVLTGNEKVNLMSREGRALFRNLKKEVIFFSCCELGRHTELMRDLLKVSRANAIFSYTDTVSDYQASITEHLAYGYVHGRESKLTLRDIYERLKFAFHFLGVDSRRDSLDDPLLVADFANDLA